MPFLTEVHFQNYRSFLDAKCRLSSVTLVIGANNAGKSNLLRGVDLAGRAASPNTGRSQVDSEFIEAFNRNVHPQSMQSRAILRSHSDEFEIRYPESGRVVREGGLRLRGVGLYDPTEKLIGLAEESVDCPTVQTSGVGVTAVLGFLWLRKNPAFELIEKELREYVPDVEKITLADIDSAEICVTEVGSTSHVPISQLSSGSRTILALLTIILQPNRPELILLEGIEHAIHPRGISPLIETMRRISKEHGVQFIFTSQHPYVLDCFRAKEFWGDVVIVEKKNGVSRLANMDDRLKRLHYEEEMDKVRLHELWYSGLMGGVANPPPAWDKEP